MRYIILLTSFVLANVYGNECGNKKTVFQCYTENDKSLAVCGEGRQLFYRFGKIGKSPEKAIQTNIDDVDYILWDGNGSAAKQSIIFKNKTHSYRVFSQYQRLVDGKPTQLADADFDIMAGGGVQVIKDRKVITEVACNNKKMLDNIENYKLGEPLTKAKSNTKTKAKAKAKDNCSNTIFSCVTKTKKSIKVCKTKTDYIYQYGKVGKKPEIVLKRGHGDVIKTPWNGMGSSMTQSLGFANKSTIYSVFSSKVRAKDGAWSGGVLVEITGKAPVSIDCISNSMKHKIIDEVVD